MKKIHIQGRTVAMVVVLVPLLALFVYVALRSGPLAPIPVTVATVENRAVQPALFGIGTVEARHAYRIGPTSPGRVRQVSADVGDRVSAGDVLGEMDPVDLDDRIAALEAALKRAEAQEAVAEAQAAETTARLAYAETQARRYEQLAAADAASAELLDAKRQERAVAAAGLAGARANQDAVRHERTRLLSDRDALLQQRAELRLIAPVDGLVVSRLAEPGTTAVAGQPVIEMIDPASLWINVRFDQLSAAGLRDGLPSRIALRSQGGEVLAGRVVRVEPLADSVTEEILAKVAFDAVPARLPSLGELAEVTVELPALPAGPSLPNAAIRRLEGQVGVWRVVQGGLRFTPVVLGTADLDGHVQVREGLAAGDPVVVYSARALSHRSRIAVVDRIPGRRR
jgi:RND family efflux transporter MFP subunit